MRPELSVQGTATAIEGPLLFLKRNVEAGWLLPDGPLEVLDLLQRVAVFGNECVSERRRPHAARRGRFGDTDRNSGHCGEYP